MSIASTLSGPSRLIRSKLSSPAMSPAHSSSVRVMCTPIKAHQSIEYLRLKTLILLAVTSISEYYNERYTPNTLSTELQRATAT